MLFKRLNMYTATLTGRVASKRVSFDFPAFCTRVLLLRFLYAYDTSTPGLDVFCRAHGNRQRGAPLATVQRTPSHNAQCMSLSTTVQHMPQPCRTMNALACQTF